VVGWRKKQETHGNNLAAWIGAIGRGAREGWKDGGDSAAGDWGEDREGAGSEDGWSGDPGGVHEMEAPAFSGAGGAEECGIYSVDEQFGAGGADGAGKPAGD